MLGFGHLESCSGAVPQASDRPRHANVMFLELDSAANTKSIQHRVSFNPTRKQTVSVRLHSLLMPGLGFKGTGGASLIFVISDHF